MAGRKPTVAGLIDKTKHKKSQSDIDRRVKNEKSMQVSAALRCPKHLSDGGKREWRRIMALYRKMEAHILSDLDRNALIAYCEAVSIYNEAQKKWKDLNAVVSSDQKVQRILDKIITTMEKQSAIIFKFSEQLCLTPIGRAKMGLHMPKKKSKLEQMMEDNE